MPPRLSTQLAFYFLIPPESISFFPFFCHYLGQNLQNPSREPLAVASQMVSLHALSRVIYFYYFFFQNASQSQWPPVLFHVACKAMQWPNGIDSQSQRVYSTKETFGSTWRHFWLLHWGVLLTSSDYTAKHPARHRREPCNKELSDPKCQQCRGWKSWP